MRRSHAMYVRAMLKIIRNLPRTGFSDTSVSFIDDRLRIAAQSYSLDFENISEHSILLRYRFFDFTVYGYARIGGMLWCEIDLVTREVFFRNASFGLAVFKRKKERMEPWITNIKRLHAAALLQV